MRMFQFVTRRIEHYRQRTADGVQNVKDVFFRGGLVALIAAVIIWIAIFLYVAFYYTYMPSISHVRPVHLQFESCADLKGICSFPAAHVQLTRKQQLLMVGQPYKMHVNLEMPESPANQRLGMFMVCVRLKDKDTVLVARSCRSAMLHYRSTLLHTLTTLFLSPMMMFGNTEEKQNILLEIFNDFEEDQNHPVTDVYVEIQSLHVELYSATLYIQAHFTGLRFLMFHWPILSAAVGIISNLFVIVLICTLSWCHLYQSEADEDPGYQYGVVENEEDQDKFKGELDDILFEDMSFMEDAEKLKEGRNTLSSPSRECIRELQGSDSMQELKAPS